MIGTTAELGIGGLGLLSTALGGVIGGKADLKAVVAIVLTGVEVGEDADRAATE